MCTNFIPAVRHEIAALGADLEASLQDWPGETYPGYLAPVLLRGGAAEMQCRLARFGLVPHWCKDRLQAESIGRGTYNARSETAHQKPSFRTAWRQRQWAVVPMQSYFEPCWEDADAHGGKAVRWQMAMADGAVFGAAGLWDSWVNPQDGEVLYSFSLLTVNADGHAVMGRMHRPGDEKRMPVLLAPQQFAGWLQVSVQDAPNWMRRWPAEQMLARAAPRADGRSGAASGPTPVQQNLSLF